MKLKGGRMKERLLTEITFMRQLSLMLLEVIVHRALKPFRLSTVWTDEMAFRILLVIVAHSLPHRLGWGKRNSIFPRRSAGLSATVYRALRILF